MGRSVGMQEGKRELLEGVRIGGGSRESRQSLRRPRRPNVSGCHLFAADLKNRRNFRRHLLYRFRVDTEPSKSTYDFTALRKILRARMKRIEWNRSNRANLRISAGRELETAFVSLSVPCYRVPIGSTIHAKMC